MKRNFIVSLIFFVSFSVYADPMLWKKFYKKYRTGEYQTSLSYLDQIKERKHEYHYMRALVLKKLQNYDEANQEFKKAVEKGNKSEDIYYEYGQSLFAANELEKAKKIFEKSARTNFKTIQSLYYMGHISEIMEQPKETKKYYTKIVKTKGVEKGLKQSTYTQLAELILSLVRKKFKVKEYVKKYVIPLFDRAIATDPNSEQVYDIMQRKDQVLLEYDIHPFVMKNGRRVPEKRYVLNLSFLFNKDSNVILEDDLPSNQATQKESSVYETSVYGKYRYIWGKRFILSPELRAAYIDHSESATEIKQNNSYYYSPALRSSLEHNLGKKKAGFLIEYEYNKTYRDLLGDDNVEEYSTSSTFIVGERIGFFNRGDTTLKLKWGGLTGHTNSLDNSSFTFYLDQMYSLDSVKLLIFLFQYATTAYDNSPTEDSSTMTFRVDFIRSQLWERFSLSLGFMYTLLSLDDASESADRGTEATINPSFGLTWNMGNHFSLSFSYDYSSKSSNDPNFEYTKSVYGLLGTYAF